ncbi:ParB/RepB/Spo0J family partition protein [Bifidobacterium sp. ESL0784]|uniref:ParB/RepB/Spo0J family partition protein n=1 Tax=Bifidobacterium sp. ESL0784 TaxID=2983231 RepID=UPI0023F67AC7|nr:ParB/RepB/Spo0J family partition protein [Bifidobacterium sp. ESL0784]MDF7640004.1 ParB/RepB/Spo0J family partition protein [Bifidobacterium sp. ESL0784]
MASKSRLGKGLGALFPTLPGESEKAASVSASVSEPSQQSSKLDSSDNVSRETSVRKKASLTNKAASPSSKTSSKHENKNVSRETSNKKVSNSSKSAKTSSKASARKNSTQKKNESKRNNVSRETSSNSSRRRVAMPSLSEGMAHPSDLFFGATVGTGETDETDKSVTDKKTDRSEKLTDNDKGIKSSAKKPTESKEVNQTDTNELRPVEGGYLVELDLDKIGPNANQPRTIFDEDELKELAASLKEVGVLQPVVVRKRPANQKVSNSVEPGNRVINRHSQQNMDSEYELIMGERRWRAAHLAGLKSIPAIVKTTSDNQMLRDALLENLHRVALNPLEESAAYQQMMQDFGLTQEQLSKSVSKSRSQIANTLRLLNLPLSVQKKVAAGVLSAGHARALLGLPNEEEMEKLANRIIAEGLSVRSTEEIVAMKTSGKDGSAKQKIKQNNPWAQSPIQHTLEDRFDTKVAIKGNKKRGRIEIVFSSPEDMERIVKLLVPQRNNSTQNGWV